jgi:FkbM family methyltransferase
MPLRRLQPLYETLHGWAMYGMNVGGATRSFEASGEASFVRTLAGGEAKLVCFDVGANVGGYARLVCDSFGDRCDVWCFEPSPSTFAELAASMAKLPNVRCFELALSAGEGRLPFYVDARGSQFSSLTDRPGTTMRVIQTARLDDIAEKHAITRINLLKIDVEGHELAVLAGAPRLLAAGAIDRIQFEYGENNMALGTRMRDFYELLGERYELYRLVRDGMWPLGRYRTALEIAASATNYVAVARGLR